MLKQVLSLGFSVWMASLFSCGGGAGESDRLRSSCVESYIELEHTLPDGAECYNVGYSDCGAELSSDCIDYCAFDLCQPGPCGGNGDCAWLGAAGRYECAEYLIEGEPSFGTWCRPSACPPGTTGCPCLDGTCTDGSECSGGSCVDTCPSGCRVTGVSGGTVCCGGAFCSGDCIGTPCC